jgi:shikimate kinase
MNIILIGFKGSGKSTIGKLIAQKKNMQFIDTDEAIQNLYVQEKNQKKNCREIFSSFGEKYFRDLETHAIKSIKANDNLVVAVGGGTMDREENRKYLSGMGTLVFINEDKGVLFQRLKTQDIPFIKSKDDFEKLYKERLEIYEKVADVIITSKGRSVHEIAHDVIKVI